MSDADCTPGREPRSVAASYSESILELIFFLQVCHENTCLVETIINESLVCACACLPARYGPADPMHPSSQGMLQCLTPFPWKYTQRP